MKHAARTILIMAALCVAVNAQPPGATDAQWRSVASTAAIRVESPGSISHGSGVYIGDRLVLSCAHIWRKNPTTGTVTFTHHNESVRGRLVQTDDRNDLSLIELDREPIGVAPVPVAKENPSIGEVVVAAGHPLASGIIQAYAGPVEGWTSSHPSAPYHDWVIFRGRSQQGFSGGPIFNRRGCVIGPLWGTDGRTTTGAVQGRTRRFLLPWNARLEAVRLAQYTPYCPPGST